MIFPKKAIYFRLIGNSGGRHDRQIRKRRKRHPSVGDVGSHRRRRNARRQKIVVNAGQKLSLQKHDFRNEHWIIAQGTAEVTLGEKVFEAKTDTAIYIPVGTKHRVRNPETKPLVFIEVQTGETLDENDITRYEDDYGRV